ncbi:MAG: glycosyltransferase family A protein [Cyanobacteria bacterium P01_A01_bin.17]
MPSNNPYGAYLERYAEAIATELEPKVRLPHLYQFVIVIPAHNEPPDSLDKVLPQDLQNTLVIVVVNAAEAEKSAEATPEYTAALQNTQLFLEQFHPQGALFTIVPQQNQSTLLIVDCCTTGRLLPHKQGVGLARKIGGDLAVACIAEQVVASPWIHCTDADVELPLSYLGEADPEVAVAIYPFRHCPPHRNILQYEISLRFYVLQTAAAGSPYAFQNIGSLLKINARNYVAVRGFPRRRAAEDFYMLNKLAKTGAVERLQAPTVSLSSRVSGRVPFGTGAAMVRLTTAAEMQLYDPEIFRQLQIWLALADKLWCDRTLIQQWGLAKWWPAGQILLEILQGMGLEKVLMQAHRQCRDFPHFRFFIWGWFDAFRTLKFVHALRDRKYPSLSICEAVAQLDSLSDLDLSQSPSDISTLQTVNDRLIDQENQLPSLTGPTLQTL